MSSAELIMQTRDLPEEKVGDFLSIEDFRRQLDREKHRTDRTECPFTLMLFGIGQTSSEIGLNNEDLKELASMVQEVTRASDYKGWFLNGNELLVGVLMPDTKPEESGHLFNRVKASMPSTFTRHINLSTTVYSYPVQADLNTDEPARMKLISEPVDSNMVSEKEIDTPSWKRTLDIVGALTTILLLSPIWILVSLYIKLVSPGPVFFKQKRVGLGGNHFMMIKFRTMSVKVDPDAHRRYVESLIKAESGNNDKPMIKQEDRPEIIPGGKIIRSLCLDEIPQLLNVLKGEMSMVGPRPAMEYEVQQYAGWHHKRLYALPGMTGLWQVSGKNRLTFNEMVRLDIRYTRQMSFITDLRILLKTIPAIIGQLSDMFWKDQTLMEKVPENA